MQCHKFLLIQMLGMPFMNPTNHSYCSAKTRICPCWLPVVDLKPHRVWSLFFSSAQNCCFNAFFFCFDKVQFDLGRSCVRQIFHPQNNHQIKYQMAKSTLSRFWNGIWQTSLWFNLGHPEVLGYSKKNNQHYQVFFWSEGSLHRSRKADLSLCVKLDTDVR